MNKKAIIVVMIIAFLIYYPVIYGLKDAFIDDNGRFTLEYLLDIINRPNIINALKFSFEQALLSSLLATVIGSIASLGLLILGFKGAKTLRSLSIIPFMAPPMVVVVGFTSLFGEKGWVTSIFPQLRFLGEGFWGIIAAHVFYNIPLSLNFTYSSFVSIPREIVDSINLYSSGKTVFVFRKVIIPYILPAMISSYTLTFIYCFTSFAIPLSIGGVRYSTLEVYIYYYYKLMMMPHKAAAIAFIQYLVLLSVVFIFTFFHGKTYAPPIGYTHYKLGVPKPLKAILYTVTLLVFLYLYMPLFSIIYTALYNPYTSEINLHGFHRILGLGYDPALGTELALVYFNTLYYAMMTAFLSLVLCSIIVYFGTEIVDALYVSLLAISPLTLSLGLLRAYSYFLPPPVLIILAHTYAAIPLVIRVLRIGFERIGRIYVDVAKVLGEKGFTLYARVIYPLMRPSYLVALSLALVVSLGEFGATFFLSTNKTITLAVAIYVYRGVRDWQASGAAATLLLLITSIILLILSRKMERWL
ncbi:MAG: iron ABC transporter permease [Staphylothermus sp.]|nr:iron ABC transporter permease [Staphylothermus sp.]